MRIVWFASFRNVRIILLRCRHFGALPTRLSAALAKQNVSKVPETRGATTRRKIGAIPLAYSFHKTMKNYESDFMSDRVGRLFFRKNSVRLKFSTKRRFVINLVQIIVTDLTSYSKMNFDAVKRCQAQLSEVDVLKLLEKLIITFSSHSWVFGINLFLIWVLIKFFEFIWVCCRGSCFSPSLRPLHPSPSPAPAFKLSASAPIVRANSLSELSSLRPPRAQTPLTRSREARNPPAGFQTLSLSLAPPLSKLVGEGRKQDVWWRISRWSGPLHHEPRQNGRMAELNRVPLVACSSDE